MRPARHISTMTIREVKKKKNTCSRLQSPSNNHPDTALSVNKVSRTRWTPPSFLPGPRPPSLPSLFTTLYLKDADLWRSAGNCQCRKMKCTCASHFVRVQGSTASARNSTQLVQNLQGMAARRRWMLAADGKSTHMCICVRFFVCHWGRKEAQERP